MFVSSPTLTPVYPHSITKIAEFPGSVCGICGILECISQSELVILGRMAGWTNVTTHYEGNQHREVIGT